MTCSVELLCVGNELLVGKTVNTNATWLARKITSLGGSVNRVTTVGDDEKEILEVTRSILARRPDMLLTSGGLGPTFDDITIKGLSRAVRLPLRVNKEALNQIKARYQKIFSSRRFVLTKFRIKMATFPIGARPLLNPVGTAPGMALRVRKTLVVCLPGVPKELRAIFSRHIAPMIKLKAGTDGYVSRTIRLRGIFESELAPLLDRVMRRYHEVYVKSHPRGGEGRAKSRIELDFSYSGCDVVRGRRVVSGAIAQMKRLMTGKGQMAE